MPGNLTGPRRPLFGWLASQVAAKFIAATFAAMKQKATQKLYSATTATVSQSLPKFGMRLNYVRNRLGLTLEAFGVLVGVSKGYLSKLEAGKFESPSGALIQSICATLDVSRLWLERGEGEPFQSSVLSDAADMGLLMQSLFSGDQERIAALQIARRVLGPCNSYRSLIERALVIAQQRPYGASLTLAVLDVLLSTAVSGLIKRSFESGSNSVNASEWEKLLTEYSERSNPLIVAPQMDYSLKGLIELVRVKCAKQGQAAAAAAAKVSVQRINDWLRGDRSPGGEAALRLLNWVLELEETNKAKSPESASTAPGPTTHQKKAYEAKPKAGP